jgi:predicted transcriptional regulator
MRFAVPHYFRVHYFRMRNVTLSAEDELVDRARLVARQRHTTLNEAFREWLRQFTSSESNVEAFDDLMERLKGVNAGRHFTRDEMNER